MTEHQWDPRWSEAALQNRVGDLTENCSQDGRRPWGLHRPEPVPEHPHSRAELRQADQHALLRLEAGECRAARRGVKPHREDMLGFKITPSFSHRRVWRLGCTTWGPSLPPTPSSSPWTRRSWRRHSRPRPRSRRSKSATRRPWCALWRTRTSAWCAARKRFRPAKTQRFTCQYCKIKLFALSANCTFDFFFFFKLLVLGLSFFFFRIIIRSYKDAELARYKMQFKIRLELWLIQSSFAFIND